MKQKIWGQHWGVEVYVLFWKQKRLRLHVTPQEVETVQGSPTWPSGMQTPLHV
jgi:hypothetical protein